MSRPTHLLYLHGFRSSPQSFKAQRMAAWVRSAPQAPVWHCPQLPSSPAMAVAETLGTVAAWGIDARRDLAIVGSSLGGFYAGVMAQMLGCRAVLINPAVEPARDLARYIGEQSTWQDPQARFHFRAEYVSELAALQQHWQAPLSECLAIIARGDELLDWREMVERCDGALVKLLPRGDHALSDFDAHLVDVLRFLELS